MGKDAPAEFIIATISSICTIIFTPPLLPLFHRFSRPAQRRVLGALGIFTVAVIVLFAGPWWNTYDSMHPKRAGFQYTYNVSFALLRFANTTWFGARKLIVAHDGDAYRQHCFHGLWARTRLCRGAARAVWGC